MNEFGTLPVRQIIGLSTMIGIPASNSSSTVNFASMSDKHAAALWHKKRPVLIFITRCHICKSFFPVQFVHHPPFPPVTRGERKNNADHTNRTSIPGRISIDPGRKRAGRRIARSKTPGGHAAEALSSHAARATIRRTDVDPSKTGQAGDLCSGQGTGGPGWSSSGADLG